MGRRRIGRSPEKGHRHGRERRLPRRVRETLLTTRWRGPACSRLPQEGGRSLRCDFYGRAVGGRPVRVRRRHPRCQAGPALCLHGDRHRRLREGPGDRPAGAGRRPAGARQGRPAVRPRHPERHQRAALRLDHGHQEGVEGRAEGLQGRRDTKRARQA